MTYFRLRPETPPNTPQRARIAAQQHERNNRILDSPQRHRTPHIAPLRFNNAPLPLPLPNTNIPDDPFAPAPGPVHFNGQQYNNLPPHLAQQLQNLPALHLPPARGRGHSRVHNHDHGHNHLPPVSLLFLFLSFLDAKSLLASAI